MFRQISILLILVFFMIGSAYSADKWVMQKFESQAMEQQAGPVAMVVLALGLPVGQQIPVVFQLVP